MQQLRNSNPTSDPKSISFGEVSKHFSSPLSDAAETLGVCTSVLRKICHENGLVRWPYRKCLSGKSIEEILKEAVSGKKELPDLSKLACEKTDTLPNSSLSSLPSQPQTKSSRLQETPKSRADTQQLGGKNTPQNLHGSNLIKGSPGNMDEFKYGFPSHGLSTASYRWWGSDNPGRDDGEIQKDGAEDVYENKQAEESIDDVQDKTGSNSNISLSATRKRAANEGREALKLGIYRGSGSSKLGRREKALLLQIFKSSFPNQWR